MRSKESLIQIALMYRSANSYDYYSAREFYDICKLFMVEPLEFRNKYNRYGEVKRFWYGRCNQEVQEFLISTIKAKVREGENK